MTFFMTYRLWIPLIFIHYCLYNYISWKNNQDGSSRWYIFILFLFGFVPAWLFISRYSKDILTDGLIYDFILLITFPLTMWYVGETSNFNTQNWIGLIIILIGFIFLKLDMNLF